MPCMLFSRASDRKSVGAKRHRLKFSRRNCLQLSFPSWKGIIIRGAYCPSTLSLKIR